MSLWFEITARAPAEDVDAVAAIMRDVSPGGVSVEEAIDVLGPEMGFRVRRDQPVLVRAYLPSSELGAVLTENLRRAMEAFPTVELTAGPIYEQDWAVSWREFFGVVDTGRIVVVPSWLQHDVQPDQIPILLDPGRAFGTGHHETTRLCLAALADLVGTGASVLDVGTGSGVLAIAAAKLGAAAVDALDIDPIAVEVARENCVVNGVVDRVNLEAGTLTAAHVARYDVVVANISADANIGLAEEFGKVVSPGGNLALSGILSRDAGRVRDVVTVEGFALSGVRHERDWCLLEFRKDSLSQ